MRLHIGAIPESAEFEPEAQGWKSLREPSPAMFQVWALPVAVFNIALLACLWSLVPSANTKTQPLMAGIGIAFVLLALIPVHELLHALAAPGGRHSGKVIIGVWPQKGLFYAHYDGAMPRNRFLLVFFMPFFVLSLLPIPFAALWVQFTGDGTLTTVLQVLSFLNGAAACGDILGIFMIGKQVPAQAIVRNQGWKTFWKVVEQDAS